MITKVTVYYYQMHYIDSKAIAERLEQVGITSYHRLSCGRKREAIDAYLLLLRSKEELLMLEEDAQNCLDYYKERQEVINAEIASTLEVNAYAVGKKSMLNNLLRENYRLLARMEHVLSLMKMKQPTHVTDCDTDLDSSDDEEDCI